MSDFSEKRTPFVLPSPSRPTTPERPCEEVLHRRTLVDPYRWLEDGGDPEVGAWTAAQNAYTAALLDRGFERNAIRGRLARALSIGTVTAPVERSGRFFFTRRDGSQDQPILYVRDGIAGEERVVLDPNSAGGSIALDWWYPSREGRLLAYGYSDHGDEKSTLYVMDVETGSLLADTIPHTRYSSIAWEPGGSGFYYTRYPAPGSVPAGEEDYHCHLFHHRIGSHASSDPELFGEGRDMTETPSVALSPNGRWLIYFVHVGWARNEVHACDLRATPAVFRPVIAGIDARFSGAVRDDTLYLLTDLKASRGRVIAVDLNHSEPDQWRELVPVRRDVTVQDMAVVGDRIILHEVKDVVSQIGVYTARGEPAPSPVLPELASVASMSGEWDSDNVFIACEAYTMAPTVLRYQLASGTLTTFAAVEAPAMDDVEVRRTWYRSKDGTQVPIFIASKRGLERNGDLPTVLNGYGGFNISRSPAFTRPILPWLEAGGIFAVANLRGGSEYGEDWHRGGMLANKQNVFDDFHAAAEFLFAEGYTRPERLAIWGGSNGGLLVGAALTQRPELFRAVVCAVPLLDMLRYHHFRIAKLWVPEYGSADDAEQSEWLWAYSPYHHVQPGVRYPAVLLTTAESDSRVDPMHARKMTAVLQASSTGGPVLLRVEVEAGHGQGKPLRKMLDEQTDIWTFVAWQLGVSMTHESASGAPRV